MALDSVHLPFVPRSVALASPEMVRSTVRVPEPDDEAGAADDDDVDAFDPVEDGDVVEPPLLPQPAATIAVTAATVTAVRMSCIVGPLLVYPARDTVRTTGKREATAC
jgi:hypothetical protein